jgi:protein-arginine kinase activator protein McsA
MNALELIEKIKKEDYHPDIIFLKERLEELFRKEEYEKIDRVQKWVEDLIKYYHLD